MDLSALALFCTALVLAAGSPGPSVAALISRVLTRGWRDVLPFLAAMWLGEVLWLTAAIVGLAALVETFHAAFVVVKYLGVAYLLYLAWQLWVASNETGASETARPLERADRVRMFAAGMAVTLGNPKIMLFYLALLPTIVDVSRIGLASWAVLAIVTATVLIAIDLTYVLLASRARMLLRSPRAVRLVNRVSAGALGGAAVAIASR